MNTFENGNSCQTIQRVRQIQNKGDEPVHEIHGNNPGRFKYFSKFNTGNFMNNYQTGNSCQKNLTTGLVLPSGHLVHQKWYRPSGSQ